MGDLFGALSRRSAGDARRFVAACFREIPDLRAVESQLRPAMLDFAVILRQRRVERVAAGEPLSAADLAEIEAAGEERGTHGISPAAQRAVLALHTAYVMREISEAAGLDDLDETMRMLAWLAHNGPVAQNAYTRGYLRGYERFVSVTSRVRLLVTMVLQDDPTAAGLATGLGVALAEQYVVMVVRVSGRQPGLEREVREEAVLTLLERHRVPLAWQEVDELMALIPCRQPPDTAAAESLGLALARQCAEIVGRPCSVGTALGRRGALVQAAVLARKVSRVAPIERVPRRPYTAVHVFAELGAVLTPQVDQWLREMGRRLDDGPDLIITLEAYYRHDMNRSRTATALHVHPRTLDYRLRRVRDLVGIDPSSTHGVRVLSTTVTRLRAGAWNEHGTTSRGEATGGW
jgi:hypothetical protein